MNKNLVARVCVYIILASCVLVTAADLSDSPADNKVGRRASSEWADDEFEVASPLSETAKTEVKKAPDNQQRAQRAAQEHYYFEAAFLVFLVFYGINVYIGRTKNEQIALSWAGEYCGDKCLFHNNFTQLGPGDSEDGEMLMKHSQNNFQLYASGRRYCSSLLATLDLTARQDLLSMAYHLYEPHSDTLEVDIHMNDSAMPPMCVLVATPKIAKALAKSRRDVAMYTKPVEVSRDRMRDWPVTQLTVLSESPTVFYDLFSDVIMESTFSSKSFTPETAKLFRYALFTTDNESGPKKTLRFSFVLPPADRMHELRPLMELVMRAIDVVGTCSMPDKVRQKAEAVRAEERKKNEKEARRAQDEELQRKKANKKEAELERIKKLGPEARDKYEERQKRVEQQRMLKKRTVKA